MANWKSKRAAESLVPWIKVTNLIARGDFRDDKRGAIAKDRVK